ncbi:MAG: hypothetical protein ACQESE_04755 [Nanobdellota archaeon]
MFPEESNFEEVYSDGGREDMVDNDGMSADEEAFMSGYDQERNKTAANDESPAEDSDDVYEQAFAKKKRRRSKRQSQPLDTEEIEAEVTLH